MDPIINLYESEETVLILLVHVAKRNFNNIFLEIDFIKWKEANRKIKEV